MEKSSTLQNDIFLDSPSLKIEDIRGGLGLLVAIRNDGESDLSNIVLNINVSGGLIIKLPIENYETPLLPIGETVEERIEISGIGLGLITDMPEIMITISALEIAPFKIRVAARILGPFVKIIGEYWNVGDSFNGYTIFSPMMSTSTFLINNSGEVVHTWESHYRPRISVYLLENGNILRTGDLIPNPVFAMAGGNGGNVEIIDWNGTVLWDFEYSTDLYCLHHDVEMLPNGNILMIAWEYKTAPEAIDAGRNPNSIPMGQLWPDHIIEVEPTGPTSGDIVWEWHTWDHLIQDYDPVKNNYGVVEDHPELIDINFFMSGYADWTHTNAVDYNEEFDQIILSIHSLSEFWIIDHSTTTEQAAGHTGGRSGKGGDILYRWGNPQTYRAGGQSDQQLYGQHDVQWIEQGCPGGGNILVFNNGLMRPGGGYSSVEEIVPPVDENGNYSYTPGSAYEPEEPIWIYTAEDLFDFFAINLAGAQRLPNGNTLICNGPHGLFFEVTEEKEIVWEYINTIPNMIDNHVFKIEKYAPDYPGLANLFT